MGANDLELLSLLSLFIFLVPIFYINRRLRLFINKTIVVSVLRMCVQLGFVGLYLKFLFKYKSSALISLMC
ncbi:MAG: ABC transporter permease [Desulfobacterales bacterium]|nr:ABC transporter permease [Desulfobacterales bacterium]